MKIQVHKSAQVRACPFHESIDGHSSVLCGVVCGEIEGRLVRVVCFVCSHHAEFKPTPKHFGIILGMRKPHTLTIFVKACNLPPRGV